MSKLKCYMVILFALLIIDSSNAQNDFAKMVRQINTGNYAAVVNYMSSVITGNIDAQEDQVNQAYFWLAEAYYRDKTRTNSIAASIPFHSNTSPSIYHKFETSGNKFSKDDKFYKSSIEKMAWCIFRQAELKMQPDDQERLYRTVIKFINDNSSLLKEIDTNIWERIKILEAESRLRIHCITKFYNTDENQLSQIDLIINSFPEADQLKKDLFKVRANLEKSKIQIFQDNLTDAENSFENISSMINTLRTKYANSFSNLEKQYLDYYMAITKLYLFTLSESEQNVSSLNTIDAKIHQTKLDHVKFRTIDVFDFFMFFDENTLIRGRIRPDELQKNIDNIKFSDPLLNTEAYYWKGWAQYLKSYGSGNVEFAGKKEFESFIQNINLPANQSNTELKNRNDFIAVDGCYRLAEIYFNNDDINNARNYYQQINSINSPYKAEINKNLLICDVRIISPDRVDEILPQFLYELKFREPNLSDNDKLNIVFSLARRCFLKGIKNDSLAYLEICDRILSSLFPGFNAGRYRNYRIEFPPAERGIYNVILTINNDNPLYAQLNFLKAINMIEMTSYQSLSRTVQTLEDVQPYLNNINSAELGDEISYTKGIIDYVVGQNNEDERAKKYGNALEKFNSLLGRNSYVSIRSLLRIGMTFDALNENEKAIQCFQKILKVVTDKADFVYKSASERMGIQTVNVPDNIQYNGINGTITINLKSVNYHPLQPGVLTYESIENEKFAFADLKKNFISIWQRYSLPNLTIHPSIWKTKNYNELLFPVFSF